MVPYLLSDVVWDYLLLASNLTFLLLIDISHFISCLPFCFFLLLSIISLYHLVVVILLICYHIGLSLICSYISFDTSIMISIFSYLLSCWFISYWFPYLLLLMNLICIRVNLVAYLFPYLGWYVDLFTFDVILVVMSAFLLLVTITVPCLEFDAHLRLLVVISVPSHVFKNSFLLWIHMFGYSVSYRISFLILVFKLTYHLLAIVLFSLLSIWFVFASIDNHVSISYWISYWYFCLNCRTNNKYANHMNGLYIR